MHSHVIMTPQLFNGEKQIKSLTYCQTADSLFAMASHSETWALNGMRGCVLNDLLEKCPECEQVIFTNGDHDLRFDDVTNTWSSLKK